MSRRAGDAMEIRNMVDTDSEALSGHHAAAFGPEEGLVVATLVDGLPELHGGVMGRIRGTVRCAKTLNDSRHWR